MQHAYHCHAEYVILYEHRIAQAGAGTHEYCRHDVGDKWIGEAHAGKRRVFGRKVLTESKTRDDAQVERQIAEVVQDSSVDAISFFKHGPRKDYPHQETKGGVEEKIDECPAIRMRDRA